LSGYGCGCVYFYGAGGFHARDDILWRAYFDLDSRLNDFENAVSIVYVDVWDFVSTFQETWTLTCDESHLTA